nr:MAG TPA: Sar8.2 family [Caudoviricetes sp.]
MLNINTNHSVFNDGHYDCSKCCKSGNKTFCTNCCNCKNGVCSLC